MSSKHDLVWLEVYMPEANNSEKQQFLQGVEALMQDGGLPEMEARKRAHGEILKARGME